jgi:hypothetical protein
MLHSLQVRVVDAMQKLSLAPGLNISEIATGLSIALRFGA